MPSSGALKPQARVECALRAAPLLGVSDLEGVDLLLAHSLQDGEHQLRARLERSLNLRVEGV